MQEESRFHEISENGFLGVDIPPPAALNSGIMRKKEVPVLWIQERRNAALRWWN